MPDANIHDAPADAGPAAYVLPAHVPVLCACGLIGLFAYFIIYDYHRLTVGHFGDFPTYYDAARAMAGGRDPYALWGEQYYIYPPLFAFLVTPLTKLSLLGAVRVFLGVDLVCMAASLLVGAREMLGRLASPAGPVPRGAVLAVALLTALLTENTIRGALQSQETDVLMLFMFTLAFAWLDRRPLLSGAALAFALNIKYLSIVALPWLLLRRRWRAAAGMAAGTVGFALLPALLLGWHEDVRCVRVALSGPLGWVHGSSRSGPADPSAAPADGGGASPRMRSAHVLPVYDNVSTSITSSLARRVVKAGGRSLWPAFAAAAAVAAACVALAAWMYARNRVPCWVWPAARAQSVQPFRWMIGVEWAGLIAFVMAFSPDTNMRHIVLVVLVNTAAAAVLLFGHGRPPQGREGAGRHGSVSRTPLVLGAALLCVALLLPWKWAMGPKFFVWWYTRGVPSWCLLVMYGTLLWVGLRLASSRSPGAGRDAKMSGLEPGGPPPVVKRLVTGTGTQ